jgi:hypothetical protein
VTHLEIKTTEYSTPNMDVQKLQFLLHMLKILGSNFGSNIPRAKVTHKTAYPSAFSKAVLSKTFYTFP